MGTMSRQIFQRSMHPDLLKEEKKKKLNEKNLKWRIARYFGISAYYRAGKFNQFKFNQSGPPINDGP